MFGRTLLSFALLTLAAVCICSAALAQETPYGRWVTDPSNIATPVFVFGLPPAGFDPLTASEVELEQWGFPPRPGANEVQRYARWKKMVTATRITPELKPTAIYNALPRDWKVTRSVPGSVTLDSSNWSGFAFTAPVGTFAANNSEITTEWIMPDVLQAPGICSSTADYSSQWVGFDGAPQSGSTDILQAGTQTAVTCANNVELSSYSAWVEWFPAASMEITNFAVEPGSAIAVDVFYTTSSPQGHAYFTNLTTNQSASMAFSKLRSPRYGGDSAEWIMERPTVGGVLPDLPNFGFFAFNNAAAYNGTSVSYIPGSNPSGTTSEEITMVCPPWNPATSCETTTNISTFNLNTGRRGDTTMWFTADPPAGAQ